MKLTNLKYILLFVTNMLLSTSLFAMEQAPVNPQEDYPAGTVWLRVNNKTNRNYAIFASGKPFVQIKAGESRKIESPVPIDPIYNESGKIKLAIKDPQQNMKKILELDSMRHSQPPAFVVYLVYSMEFPERGVLSEERIDYNPSGGKDGYSIQLTLDGGEDLEKSFIEVVGIQQ